MPGKDKKKEVKKPRMFLTDKEYAYFKSEIKRVMKLSNDFLEKHKNILYDEEIQSNCKD